MIVVLQRLSDSQAWGLTTVPPVFVSIRWHTGFIGEQVVLFPSCFYLGLCYIYITNKVIPFLIDLL